MLVTSSAASNVFTRSRIILYILGKLPDPIKRAVILISLAAKVQKFKPEDIQVISAINHALNLVEHDESLKFPVAVRELIWVNIEPVSGEIHALQESVDSSSRLREFALHLARTIPASLCYASETAMVNDFYHLFHTRA